MRKFIAVLLFALLSVLAFAQAPAATDTSPDSLYAAGISYNQGASPAISGTGLYAHKLADNDGKPTYAFTVVDALPATYKPFTVTTNFGVGVAQKVFSIGKVPFYVPTATGITYTGQNTGWNWSTGVMPVIRVKDNWRICPNVRIVRNNLNGSGAQPIVGVLFGWGQ